MTTSPHKAEILSSSLEAFKKIQQERASMCTANDVKILGPACPNFQSIDKSAGKRITNKVKKTEWKFRSHSREPGWRKAAY